MQCSDFEDLFKLFVVQLVSEGERRARLIEIYGSSPRSRIRFRDPILGNMCETNKR